MFVARPLGVGFSPATTAGMEASFRVSLGGKKVGATAPVKHARFGWQNPSNLPSSWSQLRCQPQWCLTHRSRRGPTSKCQARAVGWRIFHRAGLALCCRSRLSSNVRHHKTKIVATLAAHAAQSAESQAANAQLHRERATVLDPSARSRQITSEALVRLTKTQIKYEANHVSASRELAVVSRVRLVSQFVVLPPFTRSSFVGHSPRRQETS